MHRMCSGTCAQIFRVPSTGSPASSLSAGLRLSCRVRIRDGAEVLSESSAATSVSADGAVVVLG